MVNQKIDYSALQNGIKLTDAEFRKLSSFIYKRYGVNIPPAKKTLLESRLQKRLKALNLHSFKDYLTIVIDKKENDEMVKMMDRVSTNKTDFFRESAHFDFMTNNVLANYQNNLNIWCAASSSGEEVYTLGITIEEYLAKNNTNLKYSILGTDISTEMLNIGLLGIYNEERIAKIPLEIKRKYFLKSKEKSKSLVRVTKELRSKVTFQRHNLIEHSYPSTASYDIIFCRNVLIYFDKPTQEKIIMKLCNRLKKGGYFFLGHSESIIGINAPLQQLAHTTYQKT
ncbi:CheR family methyltransferase [Flammeovirgaceae bacterium SG7u.111]|nr:CheR family methyltransferase [Flammeovirgaceae bacterium SG7u.132]WPO33389.1 CheR family methyltransferase [Flammeovirgaceae bacterium SG7u.111]